MTELPSSDNKRTSRPWLLQTFGLAFGVSVVMVAIVFVGLLALESSSSRRVTTAQAAPAQVIAAVTPEPTATEAPTATAVPTEPATLAPTATSLPTQTPLPTATATPLPTATVKTVARSVVAAPKSTTPVARRSAATVTATPVPSAFDVSFYVKAWCGTRKIQTLQFMITGHGGQPPYDYYNDSTLLAKGEFGSVKYTFDAPSGNPVPVKLIVLDSAGHRFVQDMFYKTHLKCGGL